MKILLISGAIAAVLFPLLRWFFNKINIGKKQTREEMEERNFGKKN